MPWSATLLQLLGFEDPRRARARARLQALRRQTRLRGTPVPARPRRFVPRPV